MFTGRLFVSRFNVWNIIFVSRRRFVFILLVFSELEGLFHITFVYTINSFCKYVLLC